VHEVAVVLLVQPSGLSELSVLTTEVSGLLPFLAALFLSVLVLMLD
jgi:hypothetical protein